jgi:heat-inducible transcriptional repressor
MIDLTSDRLDERSREMLSLLIQTHIATGEPVGSRTISGMTRERLSPATVRSIIAMLEEGGYLEQPHTSAGRIPSSKGYRVYVDQMMQQTLLSASEESAIQQVLLGPLQETGFPNVDQLMSRASHLLSHFSESVGIVISPSITQDIIKHIDFVRLGDGRILVITVSRAGQVQDRLVAIDEDLTQDELNRTANYVNSNFSGMTLPAIRAELLKRLSEDKDLYDRLVQNAILIWEQALSESNPGDPEVFVEGAPKIVTNPDFGDTSLLRDLLQVFEEKSRLVKILTECLNESTLNPLAIRIGAENTLPTLRGCTVITTYYGYGNQIIGTIGVVGPVRMEYARTIGAVSYVARLLEQTLSDPPDKAAA